MFIQISQEVKNIIEQESFSYAYVSEKEKNAEGCQDLESQRVTARLLLMIFNTYGNRVSNSREFKKKPI